MLYQKTPQGFVARLERGEEIHATLTRFMRARQIAGGTVTGIGVITDVTLGFFDLEKQEYLRRQYDGEYELVSLSGNLTHAGGEPFLHAHVVMSGADMAPVSGHLFAGTIAVTGEFFIIVSDTEWRRAPDKATGLNLLDFPEKL